MLELVTIDDARQQLRLDEIDSNGGADDAWLALAIPGVSEAVRSWLKDDWRLYLPERVFALQCFQLVLHSLISFNVAVVARPIL